MSSKRRFRFGVQVRGDLLSQWGDYARHLEDLGFATLVVPDHVHQALAPMPALVAAAAATRTLRVGSVVVANDLHHPALVAIEAATVDVLSGGRYEFGLGTGWQLPDYRTLGVPFDPPGVRFARLKEAVQIYEQFFRGESVTFHGEYYRVTDLPAAPKPLQKPRPPFMLAGRQRRLLSFAAREADIVSISMQDRKDPGAPVTPFAEKVEWVRAAAGPRYDRIELHAMVLDVDTSTHRGDGIENLARKRGVAPEEVISSPCFLIGTTEEIVDQLCAWRERCDLSYLVLQAPQVDALAPVVARLAGT